MTNIRQSKIVALIVTFGVPFVVAQTAFAQAAGVGQVESAAAI